MIERIAAEPLDRAFADRPQQFHLGRRINLADLVEEQGSAIGVLEAPDPLLAGIGKGAPLMPEELALQELWRERRTVHDHQFRLRPAAQIVQGVRH